MSLINEALKRTQAGLPAAPAPLPSPARDHQVAEISSASRPRARFGNRYYPVVIAVILVVVGGVCGFLWLQFRPMDQAATSNATEPAGLALSSVADPVAGEIDQSASPIVPAQTETPAPIPAEDQLFEPVPATIDSAPSSAQEPVTAGDTSPVAGGPALLAADDTDTGQPSAESLPAAEPEPDPIPLFRLQGIMRDGKIVEAMINGYHLRVGDRVEGYEVAEISDRTVQLTSGQASIELRLR